MFEFVLLPLFLGITIPVAIILIVIKIIHHVKNGEKVPFNEQWGSLCQWTSLILGALHFLLFWSLQALLMGDTVNGVTGLYAEEIQEIEQLLRYCFFANMGMLLSLIACLKISKYEKANKHKYREVYFEKKKDAEYKASTCIAAFVISVAGYLWNLFEYAQFA